MKLWMKPRLLTRKRFCWVRNWAAGCPSSPHRRTQLWLGRAACSALWTSPPCSDSCQRSGPDSSCCSGSTPTLRLTRTVDSALSWCTEIRFKRTLLSSHILPVHITSRYIQVQHVIHILMPRWSPAAFPNDCGLGLYFWIKPDKKCKAWGVWHAGTLSYFVIMGPPDCFLCCGKRWKLPAARYPSPDKLCCDTSFPSGSANETCGWGLKKKNRTASSTENPSPVWAAACHVVIHSQHPLLAPLNLLRRVQKVPPRRLLADTGVGF